MSAVCATSQDRDNPSVLSLGAREDVCPTCGHDISVHHAIVSLSRGGLRSLCDLCVGFCRRRL